MFNSCACHFSALADAYYSGHAHHHGEHGAPEATVVT
jgi:hypothetical protein